MESYTTLEGKTLNLTGLTEAQRDYFDRCVGAYQADVPFGEFGDLVTGPENPLLAASGGRVTQDVWNHPLFQALRDLEDRLGIRQGMVAPGPGDHPFIDPLAD
jgi:hypothetical protein